MPAQLNIFLLLFGGLQGLLLTLFLLRKKLYSGGYIFLLLYLGTLLLQLTLKVMNKGWLMENWTVFYFYSYYLPLLYGPLAYLFVKYLLKRGSFDNKDILHFLPAILCYASVFANLSNIRLGRIDQLISNTHIRPLLMITSLVIYHLLAYRQWKKHRESLQHYFADARSLQLNWVRQFVIISFFTGVIIVTSLYLLYINYPFGHEYRYGFLVITLVIYWFSYTALTKPAVFSTIKGHAEVDDKNPSRITPLKVYHSVTRYANSKLEEEEVGEIQNGLKMIMENKIFLEPELTINGLAQKLNCSRHHLSQVLNEHLKQSYYDYINNFRVNEVMILLRDPARQHQKIASIAYDAGFNSLSTFNEVFKKTTGQTPSQFRKQADDAAQQQRV